MFYSNVSSIKIYQILTTIVTACLVFNNFEIEWWALSIFVYFCTGCLGITITYHRYLAHKAFKMPKVFEYLFSIFGAFGGTGSTIGWLAVHNVHHKFSDLDKDPHSPHLLGLRLLLTNYNYKFNPRDAKPLLRDKFHIFLHQYYNLILLIWALFLFALITNFCCLPLLFRFAFKFGQVILAIMLIICSDTKILKQVKVAKTLGGLVL